MSTTRLSWPRLAAFASVSFPLSTIGLPLSIYLAPFYAGDLGLSLSAIGTAMLVGRFSDIITDPLIGMASDRMRTRIGRRRPWLLIAAPLLALSVWMLFNPPVAALWSFLLWLTLTYLSFTALSLPLQAWGAELSSNYEERSRIVSMRQLFGIAGLIASTLIPAWVQSRPGATSADVLHALGLLMLVGLPLTALAAFVFVPEPPAAPHVPGGSLGRTLRQLWRNAPYRRLCIVLMIGYAAETFRITITLFFARDVIGMTNVGLLYVLYFVCGFALVPFWAWLGNRIGKHKALALAFTIVAVSTMGIFLLQRGQETLFIALFLVKGLCYGSLELLPQSMIADSADVDSVLSRTRRQGMLFAATLIVVKLGQAVGQGLSLNLLAFVGFQAAGGNGPDQLFWLRVFYCLLPPLLLLTTVPILLNHPLTAQRHRRFQRFVEERLPRMENTG
jgi:glycoside/pentoside/hexuronide:cation symporter, GPH family